MHVGRSPGARISPTPAAPVRVVARRPARRGVAPSSLGETGDVPLNAFVSIADIHDGAWVPVFLFSSFEHGAVEIVVFTRDARASLPIERSMIGEGAVAPRRRHHRSRQRRHPPPPRPDGLSRPQEGDRRHEGRAGAR